MTRTKSDAEYGAFTERTRFAGAHFLLSGILLAGFVTAAPFAEAWERTDVLHAIHQVENPQNSMRIGRRGELGPFQFRPAVWYSYTKKPFAYAADHAEALAVAEAHYDWIARGLQRNKLEPTPYNIGLAWNAGLTAAINSRTSARSRHYAERVSNLVEHQDVTKAAAVQPAASVAER